MKKQTAPLFKLLSAVLLVAVLVYFGVQIYGYATDPMTTTYLYEDTAVEAVALNGVLVRDEEVLPSSANTLYHVRTEGERVGIGQTVAVEYASSEALAELEEYRRKELQLEQLAFARESYLDGDAALKMDDTIHRQLQNLRCSVADRDYTVSEEELSGLKAAIMKRDYTYTSKEDMDSRIETLEKELSALERTLSGARAITAAQAAVYSAECDGYESVLRPEMLSDLTVSGFRALEPTESSHSNVGKLIYGDRWYYVAAVSEADAARLDKRSTVTLRFTKGLDRDVTMTVDTLTKPENGQCLLILHSDKYLSATTLLRRQSAQIILKEHQGLRIPANALRVSEGTPGVYCVAGQTACFKPVEVVYQGENFVLARAADDTNDKRALRLGDQVIVTRGELRDGMVIS